MKLLKFHKCDCIEKRIVVNLLCPKPEFGVQRQRSNAGKRAFIIDVAKILGFAVIVTRWPDLVCLGDFLDVT